MTVCRPSTRLVEVVDSSQQARPKRRRTLLRLALRAAAERAVQLVHEATAALLLLLAGLAALLTLAGELLLEHVHSDRSVPPYDPASPPSAARASTYARRQRETKRT